MTNAEAKLLLGWITQRIQKTDKLCLELALIDSNMCINEYASYERGCVNGNQSAMRSEKMFLLEMKEQIGRLFEIEKDED